MHAIETGFNPAVEGMALVQRRAHADQVGTGDRCCGEVQRTGSLLAFIGFEWTSMSNGNDLHRNLIFRGGKAQAHKIIPISQYDTTDAEVLWQWMADAEKKTGTRLLAIPHNGNLSLGLMFDDVTRAVTGAELEKGALLWRFACAAA